METNSRNKNPITIKNLEDLVLHEVLPKIPAKSLLRFKIVATHWNAFIRSVDFLKTHVRHLPSLNSRSILTLHASLVFFHFVDYGDRRLATKTFDKIQSDSFEYLLSSCNGLVFLVSPSDADIHCRSGFDFVLHNPVPGPNHFVKIPHPAEIPLDREDLMSPHYGFGFGYVSSREDYYIVAIELSTRLFGVNLNVYSVKSKQWEYSSATLRMEESSFPFQFQDHWTRNTATLIKETLHWGILQNIEHQFIFAYNLATHGYKLLPYPTTLFVETEGDYVTDTGLCCLNDCLCGWAKDGRNWVTMWTLKPHDQEGELWIKVFCICPYFPTRDIFGFNERFAVFGDDKNLYVTVLTDITCNSPLKVLENTWNAVDYVPSLESVRAIMNSEPNNQ